MISMFIEYHRNMLADRRRNDAFFRALRKVVKKGRTTVADIGSGTGLIGFFASKLGAKRVDLYEQGEVMGLSRALARANKIKNCKFIHEHSTAVTDPLPVDVVVSETLGNYAFEEQIVETISDARRFLNPGGTIIPAAIEQFVCPVTASRFFDELSVWDKIGHGLDYAAAKELTFNNIFVRTFSAKDLLAGGKAAQRWDRADFREENSPARHGKAEWRLTKNTNIYGFAVWWTATLVKGVELSTSPLLPKTHWEQLYFPLQRPLTAKKDQVLSAALRSESSYDTGTNIEWTTVLKNASGKVLQKQSSSLDKG